MGEDANKWDAGESKSGRSAYGTAEGAIEEENRKEPQLKAQSRGEDAMWGMLRNAILLSFVMALCVEAYLIFETGRDNNYASIYLVPDSYPNYIEEDTVRFSYGIIQQGIPSNKYRLDIYMGESLVTSIDLKGIIATNEVELKVSEGVMLPSKVRLVLNTDYGASEVHFWLRSRTQNKPAKE